MKQFKRTSEHWQVKQHAPANTKYTRLNLSAREVYHASPVQLNPLNLAKTVRLIITHRSRRIEVVIAVLETKKA